MSLFLLLAYYVIQQYEKVTFRFLTQNCRKVSYNDLVKFLLQLLQIN